MKLLMISILDVLMADNAARQHDPIVFTTNKYNVSSCQEEIK